MCPVRNHGVSALFPVQEEAEEIHLSHLSVCRVCGARAGKRDGRVRLRLRLSHVEFVVERKHCSSPRLSTSIATNERGRTRRGNKN